MGKCQRRTAENQSTPQGHYKRKKSHFIHHETRTRNADLNDNNYILQMLLATTSKQDTKEQPWKMMCTAKLRWPNKDKKKKSLVKEVFDCVDSVGWQSWAKVDQKIIWKIEDVGKLASNTENPAKRFWHSQKMPGLLRQPKVILTEE